MCQDEARSDLLKESGITCCKSRLFGSTMQSHCLLQVHVCASRFAATWRLTASLVAARFSARRGPLASYRFAGHSSQPGMAMSPEVQAAVGRLLEKAESGSLVQGVEELLTYLLSIGLAWKQQLPAMQIGVHELNRDGMGIQAGHVSELISSILALGYVREQAKGICIEVPMDSQGDATRAFNTKLVLQSKGKLPPADVERMRFASIVGSHSNMAHRCILAGLEHGEARATAGGRLSLERLREADKAFAHAVESGIVWTVVAHSVQSQWPQFASLVQAAGNASSQISKAEDDARRGT